MVDVGVGGWTHHRGGVAVNPALNPTCLFYFGFSLRG